MIYDWERDEWSDRDDKAVEELLERKIGTWNQLKIFLTIPYLAFIVFGPLILTGLFLLLRG